MKKTIIILFLILTTFGCKKETELPINESQFQNKTFNLIFENKKDTVIVDFQDSTHRAFGNFGQGKILWQISHYDKTDFLILENKSFGKTVVEIKKIDKGKYNCFSIDADKNFVLIERKPKWKKEMIYGIWVNKKYEKNFGQPSSSSLRPPPPLPTTKNKNKIEFHPIPFYKITNDTIKIYEFYSMNASPIEINNSNEYITMELNSKINRNETDLLWHIKSFSENKMIVERKVSKLFGITTFKTDTLIRKNDS